MAEFVKALPRILIRTCKSFPAPPKWHGALRACLWTTPGNPSPRMASSWWRSPEEIRRGRCLRFWPPMNFAARWIGPRYTFSGAMSAPFLPPVPKATSEWRGANCSFEFPFPKATCTAWRPKRPASARAAHEYEEVLRKYLDLDDRGFPRFHLIFLGMGTDGHTASLFPGTRVSRQTSRWVSTPTVTKLNMHRMTLTFPVLDAASRVVFLVVGSEKAQILRSVLEGKADPPYPAQLVQPRHRGLKIFLVDKAAAALLTTPVAEQSEPAAKPAGVVRGKQGKNK